jgi:hypothetical protein
MEVINYKLSKETTQIPGLLVPYQPHCEAYRINLQLQQPRQDVPKETFNRKGTKVNTCFYRSFFQKIHWMYVIEILVV